MNLLIFNSKKIKFGGQQHLQQQMIRPPKAYATGTKTSTDPDKEVCEYYTRSFSLLYGALTSSDNFPWVCRLARYQC